MEARKYNFAFLTAALHGGGLLAMEARKYNFAFLTAALHGGELLASRPDRFARCTNGPMWMPI